MTPGPGRLHGVSQAFTLRNVESFVLVALPFAAGTMIFEAAKEASPNPRPGGNAGWDSLACCGGCAGMRSLGAGFG